MRESGSYATSPVWAGSPWRNPANPMMDWGWMSCSAQRAAPLGMWGHREYRENYNEFQSMRKAHTEHARSFFKSSWHLTCSGDVTQLDAHMGQWCAPLLDQVRWCGSHTMPPPWLAHTYKANHWALHHGTMISSPCSCKKAWCYQIHLKYALVM